MRVLVTREACLSLRLDRCVNMSPMIWFPGPYGWRVPRYGRAVSVGRGPEIALRLTAWPCELHAAVTRSPLQADRYGPHRIVMPEPATFPGLSGKPFCSGSASTPPGYYKSHFLRTKDTTLYISPLAVHIPPDLT